MLMATAGGGHKAAAASISEALKDAHGDNVIIETVDVLKEYAPQPFDKGPEAYQLMIKAPVAWRGFYELGDGVRRSKVINMSLSLFARRSMERLLNAHPADVIVSTYHFANSSVLEALAHLKNDTPFITVVTDLVTAPPIWFDPRTTLCLVPTSAAAELALRSSIDKDKIKIIGMPVSKRFGPSATAKSKLKTALGWNPTLPAIIAMAGGEGIGSLDQIAENLSTLNVTVVVITGKNTSLFERLNSTEAPYNLNLKIYGFVSNIDEFMKAADLIITKAGPGTIVEALNSHLPLMIYSKLSGQEDGNVSYVTDNSAGVWQPKISEMANTVQDILANPSTLENMAKATTKIAQPGASAQIAKVISTYLKK